ncbi:MAG: calcium/sodium antiporter [Chloroherpetonaceae bacterium]|nr:calcium/sodium antiporter [Chthonomonadaceae bacterium]MDW8207906.1 calcium/sodium antiporter [Chloroherpetonaceae bacterium]
MLGAYRGKGGEPVLTTLVSFCVGLVTLILGAEMLVRGASRLAVAAGISPLVVGLTVVAFGTSSPELAINLKASLSTGTPLGIGNIIGSNILNILLILGLSALIVPLTVAQQLVRFDVPLMIGASLLLYRFAQDGMLDRWEGLTLTTGAVLYTLFCIWSSRRESREVAEEYQAEYAVPATNRRRGMYLLGQTLLAGMGLAALTYGSSTLVESAVAFARMWGVSELIIGLTIISVGTTLPETVTTVAASMRGERDIAVGNVVGSFLFNILVVAGMAALVAPRGVPVPDAALAFDLPVMTAVAVACLPVFVIGGQISRWEGGLFFGYYVAYTVYLWLSATGHPALRTFQNVMLFFVIPLTVLTLGVLTLDTLRRYRRRVSASQ